MMSRRNLKLDRLVTSKVLGWSTPARAEAPRFSSSPPAAIGGLLRSAVPDGWSNSGAASSNRIELSAVGSRWKLRGQRTLELTSDDEGEPELPSAWDWSDSPDVLAPVLAKAASQREGTALLAFSPSAFRVLCYGFGCFNGLLRVFPGRCGFRLEWPVRNGRESSPISWRSTIELIPGRVRSVGVSASPAGAVAKSQQRVLRVLTSDCRGTDAGSNVSVPPRTADIFGPGRCTDADSACSRSAQVAGDRVGPQPHRTRALASPVALPADQLRRWRTERSLTQEEAGLLVGVSRRAWQSWELGTNPVPKWMSLALEALAGRNTSAS